MAESFAYDNLNRVISQTSFKNETITFKYDNNGRLSEKVYPDGTKESYEYTIYGKIKAVTDKTGKTSYEYDSRGRLAKQTNPDGSTLTYTYDKAGNRTSVATKTGTTYYEYDALNRLISVKAANGEITTYGYDAVGNRTSIKYPNGNLTSYEYDNLNRLANQITTSLDGSIVASYEYILSPSGTRTKVIEGSGRTVEYKYDDVYRLIGEKVTKEDGTVTEASYTYDAIGNRLTKNVNGTTITYTYDANNRMLSENDKTYSYDANGNLINSKDAAGETTYVYDYNNKLVKIIAGETIEYQYNASGDRISTTVNGQKTKYMVDRNRDYAQVLEEEDAAGNTLVSYTYGDDLISQSRNGQTFYYIYDGQGSTRALTDAAGKVTDTYNYDAFGNLTDKTSNTVNDYLYTGEQYDANAGFYYLRARYMNPSTGRFFTMDSYEGNIFDPVSLHKYLYANADPVNNIDPTGLFTLGELAVVQSIQNMWARTIHIRSAISTYLKAEQTIERVKLGLNVSAIIAGFMFPSISRNSVGFKFKLTDFEMGLEFRYGKSALKKSYSPDQVRVSVTDKRAGSSTKGMSTRLDINIVNGVPEFDGISGQFGSIDIYKYEKKLWEVKTQMVFETKNLLENFMATIGFNFKFETKGIASLGYTARSPRFNITTLQFE